jgi:hypothetical protein
MGMVLKGDRPGLRDCWVGTTDLTGQLICFFTINPSFTQVFWH